MLIAMPRGQGENGARALAFTTLIIANLGLILTNRSWSRTILSTLRSPNTALWFVLLGAAVFLGLVLYVPVLRDLFKFDFLHPLDLWICLVAGAVSVLWFEALEAHQPAQGPRVMPSARLRGARTPAAAPAAQARERSLATVGGPRSNSYNQLCTNNLD